jgi:hypothetical protein
LIFAVTVFLGTESIALTAQKTDYFRDAAGLGSRPKYIQVSFWDTKASVERRADQYDSEPVIVNGLDFVFGPSPLASRFAYGPAVRAHPDIIAEGRRQRPERAGYALVAALGFLALSAVGYVAAWVSGWVLSGFIDRTS